MRITFSMPHSKATVPAFSAGARLRSFVYAGRGIRTLVTSQHNALIHAVATFAAVALGFSLGASRLEWIALMFAVVSV